MPRDDERVRTPATNAADQLSPARLRTRGLDIEGPLDPGVLAAALLRLSDHVVVSGPTAARLHGLDVPDGWGEELTIWNRDLRVRSRERIRVRVGSQHPSAITTVEGLHTTTLARTAADLCRERLWPEHAWVLDQVLARGVPKAAVGRHLLPGQRGVVRARDLLCWADAASESPLESALRVVLAEARLPRPVSQFDVPDAPARLDLAWPARRVALEADGVGFHDVPEALFRDRVRQNALSALGWSVLRATWTDVYRPAVLLAALAVHLGAECDVPVTKKRNR
jgi:very-short-patch-repair endonuclease